MRPAICDGDVITVAPASEGSVVAGNVIVYRDRGRLFAHRVVNVEAENGGHCRVLLRGDAAPVCDAPVSAAQVLGEVVAVRRGSDVSDLRTLAEIAGRVLRRWRRIFR
jgi:signal peptidase I